MARASKLLLAMTVAFWGQHSAAAQEDEVPPARLPDGAQLGVGAVDLGASPVDLAVATVSLSVATVDDSVVAQLPAGAWSSGDPGDEPPVTLPAGATLASAAVSLGEAAVSLPIAAAAIGSTPTDLGGLTVQAEGEGLRFTLGADVLFDFDRANLRAGADPRLRKLVDEVRARLPRARYAVEGHTDAKLSLIHI